MHYNHYVSLALPLVLYYNLARPLGMHYNHYVSPLVKMFITGRAHYCQYIIIRFKISILSTISLLIK